MMALAVLIALTPIYVYGVKLWLSLKSPAVTDQIYEGHDDY